MNGDVSKLVVLPSPLGNIYVPLTFIRDCTNIRNKLKFL